MTTPTTLELAQTAVNKAIQYYMKNPNVAASDVAAADEDLIRAHLQANSMSDEDRRRAERTIFVLRAGQRRLSL